MKFEIVESVTKPGPGYVMVDAKTLHLLEQLQQSMELNRAELDAGIADVKAELARRAQADRE